VYVMCKLNINHANKNLIIRMKLKSLIMWSKNSPPPPPPF